MSKKITKPTTTDQPKAEASAAKRRLKLGTYSSFKLQKSMKKHTGPALPGSFKLLWGSMALLWRHKKLFLGIIGLYAVLNFVLVEGFSNVHDLGAIKSQLAGSFGNTNRIVSGLMQFAYLLGSTSATTNGSTAGSAAAYGIAWAIISSLALIWVLRQLYASKKIRVRDGFYSGMYPLIPFILVLAVMILELLPGIIGVEIYSVVTANGIAISFAEQAAWGVLLSLLVLLSVYWLSASVFAAYIVCLPDMTPRKALRSAAQLVLRRRWTVMRKVFFLPIALLCLGALIMLPFITFASAIAGWLFFVLCMIALAVMHGYYYALYRSLL